MPELVENKADHAVSSPRLNRIPSSTYRLQLNAELSLKRVHDLLPYLERLGITDLYLSPLFRARAESSHGYDVVDHGTIDPAIGDFHDFEKLAEAARARGMGILLDVVPNHMGINDPGNVWWLDVLENGEGSYFADFFDIDWQPAASALQDRVLLPFLAEPFGTVLENGGIRVVYADERLQLALGERRFPLAPPTWTVVLELVAAQQGELAHGMDAAVFEEWSELQSIITQLRNLPPGLRRDPASMEERYREQQIVRRRLSALLETSASVRRALDVAIAQINGDTDDPRSFDQLEDLLEQQWYRLAYWRVAADEINYRRFFDINDLAAIRVENPRVFDAVHRLIRRLVSAEWVTGLRIDHPDGLRDPQAYFKNLHGLYRAQHAADDEAADEIYIVAEKILSGEEPLPAEWQIAGTTGYEFLNIIGRLQVDADGVDSLRQNYDPICHNSARAADIVYESKRAVLFSSMSSELQMLAAMLYRIAQKHRASRDFTRPALQRALREVIACMSVYRTYLRDDSWDVIESDYRTVTTAVRMAKRRNRTMPVSVFDFIASVWLLEHPPTVSDDLAIERREFALKLQQVTGPVAAKGVEDTAFYRYYPLASLNEVGGELDAKAISVDEFHRLMRHRNESWPHSLSATSTHDSKRGEDMRARLHVLSEVPERWMEMFNRWQTMNERFVREIDSDPVPDANEAYLIYQTLLGTWPADLKQDQIEAYGARIHQYMTKALREAKVHTSWMNPADAYESAVLDFISDVLGCEKFRAEIARFVDVIADSGYVNSLAQTVLKSILPGVPDFYQGTEFWDFNLVDPDNRRPVDFDVRRQCLERLLDEATGDKEQLARRLSAQWPNPEMKLWITAQCLALRAECSELFAHGEYLPLCAAGAASNHVVAFARRLDDQWVLGAVPCHFHKLLPANADRGGVPQGNWENTTIQLLAEMPAEWHCRLTGRTLRAGNATFDVAELFEVFPVVVLTAKE